MDKRKAAPEPVSSLGASRLISVSAPSIALLLSILICAISPNAYSLIALAAAVALGATIAPIVFKLRPGIGRRLYVAFRIFSGYYVVSLYFQYALARVALDEGKILSRSLGLWLFAGYALLIAVAATAYFLIAGKKFRKSLGVPDAPAKKGGFWFQVTDTIHALVQAALFVIALGTFVFQLMVIPSESMANSFLKSDRPFIVALFNGPKFPMSDVKFPTLRKIRRGDVIVFRSPRYQRTEASEFKRFLGQLLFKMTFSLVNLDRYLPNGEEKADPLVKRVIGVPGEKIVMKDDVVLVKKAGDASFTVLEEDAKKWSQTDLYDSPANVLSKLERLPISAEERKILSKWDAAKDAVSLEAMESALADRWNAFASSVAGSAGKAARRNFENAVFKESFPDHAATLEADRARLTQWGNAVVYQDPRVYGDFGDLLHLYGVMADAGALNDLRDYVLGWNGHPVPTADPFAENARKTSLLLKSNLLSMMARDLVLASAGKGLAEISLDPERGVLVSEKEELFLYVFKFFDMRNFPITPAAADEYIAPNRYFEMGDNRYNSLDSRYADSYGITAFDAYDPFSFYYPTNLDPNTIDGNEIEGIALFRVWPFSRFGAIARP